MPATPAWPPKSAPRLFVTEPLAAGTLVRIEGNPAHYLTRVMRVATGDAVILCDDVTGEWAARVSDVMRTEVLTVKEYDGIIDLAQTMLKAKPKLYPVVDDNGHLLGIITRSDVLGAIDKERHSHYSKAG